MTLAVGAFLVTRYRIIGLLAQGGMGAIYKAFDTNLNMSVAIKENFFQTPEGSQQFKQEALILARLRHPGLPRVIHHFSFDGQQYLVMDFIEGEDLWEMVKKEQQPLEERQALNYIIQVCDAVNYLHRQKPPIIHRDIKPQNIKITPDNRAVLVDFGIAKVGDEDAKTRVGARGVTPGFSPPEQYSGGGTKPVSDVYSLGATLYAVLTGKKPPDSVSLLVDKTRFEPPKVVNTNLSNRVSDAIVLAMQPMAEARPQSVAIWQAELQATLAGLPSTTTTDDDKATLTPGSIMASDVARAGRDRVSPAMTAKFWLVDSTGKGYPLGSEPAVIGRHSGADIVVNVLSVSRQHALVRAERDHCQVMDNGSANGTFLNNRRLGLEWHPMKPDDILMVGSARFSLTTDRPANVAAPKPATIAEDDSRTELETSIEWPSPATAELPTPPPAFASLHAARPAAPVSTPPPMARSAPPKKMSKLLIPIIVVVIILLGLVGVVALALLRSSTSSSVATATATARNAPATANTQTAEAAEVERENEMTLTAQVEAQTTADAAGDRQAEQAATATAETSATEKAGAAADRLPTATVSPTATKIQPTATSTRAATPVEPAATPSPTQTPISAASPVSAGPTVIPLKSVDSVPQIGVKEVIDVEVNARNPREVYALVKGDGIYKSSNGGEGPWAKMDLEAGSVTALAIDPTNPARLFAPTWNAVLRSDDGGNTWKAFGNGLSTANRVVEVVTVDPVSPNIVYAGIGETLVVSTDGGETWVSEGYGNNLKGGRFTSIVVDSINHDIVYAAGEFGSIYKSVDSGRNFMQLAYGTGSGTYSLVPHPTQRDVYLAGINSYDAGIIKTENGADFVSVSDGLIFGGADSAYSAIAYAPSQPNVVYAGSGYEDDRFAKGVFKSTDGGKSWNRISDGLSTNSATGQPHYVKAMAVHPANANIALAATGGGLFKTTDGGANWSLR